MIKENFDELQLKTRYKIASQCLGILLFLTIANGFINEKFVWALPSTQALVLVMITTSYFIIMTTLKDAYISNKEKNPMMTVIYFGIIAIVSFIVFLGGFSRVGMEYIAKDNMLTSSSGTLFMGLFWSVCSLTNLYKFLKNRNARDE